jgi:hypothetical protein
MRQRDKQAPQSAEEAVRDIRRATRRHFSAEEKIRIVLEGLRGEDSIAELCRKERSRGLVTSPAFIVMKAADKFAHPTTAINQLWQTKGELPGRQTDTGPCERKSGPEAGSDLVNLMRLPSGRRPTQRSGGLSLLAQSRGQLFLE